MEYFLKLLQRRGRANRNNRNKTELLGSFTHQIENSPHHYTFSLQALIHQAGSGFEYRHAVGPFISGLKTAHRNKILPKEWILIQYNPNSAEKKCRDTYMEPNRIKIKVFSAAMYLVCWAHLRATTVSQITD